MMLFLNIGPAPAQQIPNSSNTFESCWKPVSNSLPAVRSYDKWIKRCLPFFMEL